MENDRLDVLAERVLHRWSRLTLVSGLFHCIVFLNIVAPRLLFIIEAVSMGIISIDTAIELYQPGPTTIDTRVKRLILILISGCLTILYMRLAIIAY
jgi:hypothetical protein